MSDFFNIQNKKIMYLTFTRLSKKKRPVCQEFYTQQRMSFQSQTKITALKFSNLCDVVPFTFLQECTRDQHSANQLIIEETNNNTKRS